MKNAKGLGLEESSYRSIICKWKASGFIKKQEAASASAGRKTHYVKLSDEQKNVAALPVATVA